MSPRMWNVSESHDLPLFAPENIKPSPPMQQRTPSLPPSPRAKVSSISPSGMPTRITLPEDGATPAAPAASPTPTAAGAPSPTVSFAPAKIRHAETAVPTETEELAAGTLTGVRTCQALLQGGVRAEAFGVAVSQMPDRMLPLWAEEFGRKLTWTRSLACDPTHRAGHTEAFSRWPVRQAVGGL